MLSLQISGVTLSPLGTPFIDNMKLTSTSVNDIGVYNVKMNIEQDD